MYRFRLCRGGSLRTTGKIWIWGTFLRPCAGFLAIAVCGVSTAKHVIMSCLYDINKPDDSVATYMGSYAESGSIAEQITLEFASLASRLRRLIIWHDMAKWSTVGSHSQQKASSNIEARNGQSTPISPSFQVEHPDLEAWAQQPFSYVNSQLVVTSTNE